MGNDELETARPIRQPIHGENEIAGTDDAVLYPKGSAVLGMFAAHLGRERFRGAIRDYLTEHADGNAATEDLLAELDRIDPSVGPFLPDLHRSAGSPARHGRALLSRGPRRARPQAGARAARGLAGTEGPPVAGAGVRPAGGPERSALHRPGRPVPTVPVPGRCPRWVHPNAGATGYYRWLLPPAGLDALLASGWATLSRAERISAASAVVSGTRDAVLPVDRALRSLPGSPATTSPAWCRARLRCSTTPGPTGRTRRTGPCSRRGCAPSSDRRWTGSASLRGRVSPRGRHAFGRLWCRRSRCTPQIGRSSPGPHGWAGPGSAPTATFIPRR